MRKIIAIGVLLICCIKTSFTQDFRVVGFLPNYRFKSADKIDYTKLTHLIIGFAQPTKTGKIKLDGPPFASIVDKAHEAGVKVMLSLAGGGLGKELNERWHLNLRNWKRQEFIYELLAYTVANNLDGIDIDLEWETVKTIGPAYSDFIVELKQAMQGTHQILSLTLPAIHRYNQLRDDALQAPDFLNLMAYDLTGPWAPGKPGQHAPYSFAQQTIEFWYEHRIAEDQMTLGLPFFGWDFSNSRGIVSVAYGDMVAKNSAYSLVDQVGSIFYNGMTIIELKTALAIEKTGGVMIWELGQDAFNEYSLLNAVHRQISTFSASKYTVDSRPAVDALPVPSKTEPSSLSPSFQNPAMHTGVRLYRGSWIIEHSDASNQWSSVSLPEDLPVLYAFTKLYQSNILGKQKSSAPAKTVWKYSSN